MAGIERAESATREVLRWFDEYCDHRESPRPDTENSLPRGYSPNRIAADAVQIAAAPETLLTRYRELDPGSVPAPPGRRKKLEEYRAAHVKQYDRRFSGEAVPTSSERRLAQWQRITIVNELASGGTTFAAIARAAACSPNAVQYLAQASRYQEFRRRRLQAPSGHKELILGCIAQGMRNKEIAALTGGYEARCAERGRSEKRFEPA